MQWNHKAEGSAVRQRLDEGFDQVLDLKVVAISAKGQGKAAKMQWKDGGKAAHPLGLLRDPHEANHPAYPEDAEDRRVEVDIGRQTHHGDLGQGRHDDEEVEPIPAHRPPLSQPLRPQKISSADEKMLLNHPSKSFFPPLVLRAVCDLNALSSANQRQRETAQSAP